MICFELLTEEKKMSIKWKLLGSTWTQPLKFVDKSIYIYNNNFTKQKYFTTKLSFNRVHDKNDDDDDDDTRVPYNDYYLFRVNPK